MIRNFAKFKRRLLFFCLIITGFLTAQNAGNPVFPGWYADPEGMIFDHRYWIYPTFSAPYNKQVYMDAFSSPDLVNWTKHKSIVDTASIKWAKMAMWAPSIIKKGNQYFLFFAANDIQNESTIGGIGIGVADKPEGPFKDYLGKPLINKIVNGAQPIDQYVFQDTDGKYYMIYGGWKHCNIVRLSDDFKTLLPHVDGTTFKEITPTDYVEGPIMFRRNGKYYFMWSEGGWTGPDYRVAYAIGDSPFGPFNRIGLILQQNASIATGAGHHSVINVPGTDDWYIVYHRRPLGETDGNSRVTCVDKMIFNENGYIQPVVMTFDGVSRRFLEGTVTVFANCSYNGDSLLLNNGKYTQANLVAMGFTPTTISSLRVKAGYEIQLYDNDNFTGNMLILSENADCLVNSDFDDKTKSLIVRKKGEFNLAGEYYIRNKANGLYLGIKGNSRNKNAVVELNTGTYMQQFRLKPTTDNGYSIISINSKFALQIQQAGVSAGARLEQAVEDILSLSQSFTFQSAGTGFYRITNYNSDLLLTSTSTEDKNFVIQSQQQNVDSQLWELIPINQAAFSSTQDCAGVVGGGAYYDECENCVGGSTNVAPCKEPVAIFYSGCNYSAVGVGFKVGEFKTADIQNRAINPLHILSAKVKDGYMAELYDEDVFNGNKLALNTSAPCLVDQEFANKAKSIVLKRDGVSNLTGVYYLKNKQTGYYLRAQLDAVTNGAPIVQGGYLGRTSQQFRLNNAGDGYYNLIVVGSNKAITTSKPSVVAGTLFQQWENTYSDITNIGCTVSTQCDNSPASEGVEKLIDNNTSTKFLTGCGTTWVQFNVLGLATVNAYTITSANDAPERDPLNWSLKGSNDLENWVLLDSRSGVDFASRFQQLSFSFNNTQHFKYYRFEMKNNSGSNLQIAEMELKGTPENNAGFDNQKFVLQSVENGAFYKIFNKYSDLLIDVVSTGSGSAIRQWSDNGQQTALWELINADASGLSDVHSKAKIKLYPNPVSDVLFIDGAGSDTNYTIHNLLGNKIMAGVGGAVDVNSLSEGMYLLKCKIGNRMLNYSFIKK